MLRRQFDKASDRLKILMAAGALLILPGIGNAFDINPFKKYDGTHELVLETAQFAGVVTSIIIDPVHEEITVKTLNLVRDRKLPGYEAINDHLIEKVIRGVRWNDDPLHLLPDYPYDWLFNFEHASDISYRITSNFDLFYRSHHHDLQFLHAMAAEDAEPAAETQAAVLAWMEFAYKVATGYIPKHTQFRHLDNYLSPAALRLFKKHFNRHGRRLKWTPAYLFSLKCTREVSLPDSFGPLDCSKTDWLPHKQDVQNIALGSLLHVIQDSFSDSHVTRDPQYEGKHSLIHGREIIQTFNEYQKQSINLHRGADAYPEDLHQPLSPTGFNLEEVSAELISGVLSDRQGSRRTNRWQQVIAGLKNGVFKLQNPHAEAGSGKYQ